MRRKVWLELVQSEEFPGLPNIQVDVEEEWNSKNLPNSVIALVKEDGSDYSSCILIDIKKVEKSYDFEKSIEEVQNYTQNFERLNIFSNSVHEINSREWKVEEFAYIDHKVGPLAQIVDISFVASNDAKIMISFTGTTKICEEEKNKNYTKIQKILRSMKINEKK